MSVAQAFWVRRPGVGEIRSSRLSDPGPGEVLVKTLCSGVSRGSEGLVHRGGVPQDQWATMRAPFQEGDFSGPVKYGYLNVGVVEDGPPDLLGRRVFCLHPHQTSYVVPVAAVVPVPDEVPTRRAVLAGTVETAVNALWDAAPLVGDRIAVVGGGMVGLCLARLLVQLPGVELTVVDVDPLRERAVTALGANFTLPGGVAPASCDLVFHVSATSAGLDESLALLADEGTVVDLSWYGDREVSVHLGSRFHSGRLTIRSSQVGMVSPARFRNRTSNDRLALALDLLRDPGFDALLTGSSPFEALPEVMRRLSDGSLPPLCHTITYGPDEE